MLEAKEKYTRDEWNELYGRVRKHLIDISVALKDEFGYIGTNSFKAVLLDTRTNKFYKINGSVSGVKVEEVSNICIKEVFER